MKMGKAVSLYEEKLIKKEASFAVASFLVRRFWGIIKLYFIQPTSGLILCFDTHSPRFHRGLLGLNPFRGLGLKFEMRELLGFEEL